MRTPTSSVCGSRRYRRPRRHRRSASAGRTTAASTAALVSRATSSMMPARRLVRQDGARAETLGEAVLVREARDRDHGALRVELVQDLDRAEAERAAAVDQAELAGCRRSLQDSVQARPRTDRRARLPRRSTRRASGSPWTRARGRAAQSRRSPRSSSRCGCRAGCCRDAKFSQIEKSPWAHAAQGGSMPRGPHDSHGFRTTRSPTRRWSRPARRWRRCRRPRARAPVGRRSARSSGCPCCRSGRPAW